VQHPDSAYGRGSSGYSRFRQIQIQILQNHHPHFPIPHRHFHQLAHFLYLFNFGYSVDLPHFAYLSPHSIIIQVD